MVPPSYQQKNGRAWARQNHLKSLQRRPPFPPSQQIHSLNSLSVAFVIPLALRSRMEPSRTFFANGGEGPAVVLFGVLRLDAALRGTGLPAQTGFSPCALAFAFAFAFVHVAQVSARKDWCRRRGSNPHDAKHHWILSPTRLPVPPLRRRLSSLANRIRCCNTAVSDGHHARVVHCGITEKVVYNCCLEARWDERGISCAFLGWGRDHDGEEVRKRSGMEATAHTGAVSRDPRSRHRAAFHRQVLGHS